MKRNIFGAMNHFFVFLYILCFFWGFCFYVCSYFSAREIDHGKVAFTPEQARHILPGHGRRKSFHVNPCDRPAAKAAAEVLRKRVLVVREALFMNHNLIPVSNEPSLRVAFNMCKPHVRCDTDSSCPIEHCGNRKQYKKVTSGCIRKCFLIHFDQADKLRGAELYKQYLAGTLKVFIQYLWHF